MCAVCIKFISVRVWEGVSASLPENNEKGDKNMATMKKLKITLAILMTLALRIVGSPFTAMAETGDMVCTVGGSTYSSINDAVAAANDGAVITVFADTTKY